MKLRQRIILSTISGIIFILCLVYFTIRNPLLHWRIQKSVMEINQRTGATLNIGTSRFSGFLSFSMENISFIPSKGDTLLQADSVNIRISLWKLLTGTIRIKELYSSHLNVSKTLPHESLNNKRCSSNLHQNNPKYPMVKIEIKADFPSPNI